MKTVRFFVVLIVMVAILMWLYVAVAEQNTITLPKGTRVEKQGEGHFKFILPSKQIVEVKNFNPGTGSVGYVGIIDPQPPGKPSATGKQGTFKTGKKLTMKAAKKLPPENYIMIDDDPTWLPVTISFQPVAISDPDPPPSALGDPDPPPGANDTGKTRELSPQPDPPGRR